MALTTVQIPPLDPNGFTGPVRTLGGVVRSFPATLDMPYGEFMRGIYVGIGGDVSITQWDGTVVVLPNLAQGQWHYHGSIMINSVGTTASGIFVGS